MAAAASNSAVGRTLMDTMDDTHRVGPNAIIQTGNALHSRHGKAVRDMVFEAAGLGWLGARQPTNLVRAEAVVALNSAVFKQLTVDEADRVMWDAGVGTARYILQHRIPPLAQKLLGLMPAKLGMALLMRAIGRHAWTFAGAATVRVGRDWIEIDRNPVCLGRSGFSGCTWHSAVFTTLIEAIIGCQATVRETRCLARGNDCCRFEVTIGGSLP